MKFILLFYLILKILIIHVLTQNGGSPSEHYALYDLAVDLEKYKKITISSYNFYIVFDSSDFKIDEEIYFKITAEGGFARPEIYYEFFDNLKNYTSINIKPAYSTNDRSDDDGEIRYYTIKKSSSNLGSSEGKYLIIFFYCEGLVEIENIDKDYEIIITIIVIIIIIIVGIIILIVYCCKRRKYRLINNNVSPTAEQSNLNTYINNNAQAQTNGNNYNQEYINNRQAQINVNNYNQGYNSSNNQNINSNNNNKSKKQKKNENSDNNVGYSDAGGIYGNIGYSMSGQIYDSSTERINVQKKINLNKNNPENVQENNNFTKPTTPQTIKLKNITTNVGINNYKNNKLNIENSMIYSNKVPQNDNNDKNAQLSLYNNNAPKNNKNKNNLAHSSVVNNNLPQNNNNNNLAKSSINNFVQQNNIKNYDLALSSVKIILYSKIKTIII